MGRATWFLLVAGLSFGQSSMTGNWQGTLEAGPVKLRLGLHVTRNAAGKYTSTFDSIDQGSRGLPVKLTEVDGKELYLELPNLSATFEGVLSEDGRLISGVLTHGVPLPFTFMRVDRVETLPRPQER